MKGNWKKWRAVKGERTSYHRPLDRWGKRIQTCKVWCQVLNALMMRAADKGSLSTKQAYFCSSSLFPQDVLVCFRFTAAGLA